MKRARKGPSPIPDDVDAGIEARMLNRFFDNYVMTPMRKIMFDAIRPTRSPHPAIDRRIIGVELLAA